MLKSNINNNNNSIRYSNIIISEKDEKQGDDPSPKQKKNETIESLTIRKNIEEEQKTPEKREKNKKNI